MLVAAGILVLLMGLVLAQERGGAGGERSFDPAARDQERIGQVLTDAKLIGAERSAAEAALTTKYEARRDLMTALGGLRAATEDSKTTDDGLKQAVGTYEKALAKYRGVVETQDKALVAKLSVRSKARCLAVGILDNGIGMTGRRPRPAGGGGGGRRGPEAGQ
jgi:hypothetical protein